MKSDWIQIAVIWALVAVGAVLAIGFLDDHNVTKGFGILLAGALSLVAMIHLFTANHDGIVRRLIFVAGGSWAILAVAGLYILVARSF